MPQHHKGDRARITLRLSRDMVARLDDMPGDRNGNIEILIEHGMDALMYGLSAASEFATPPPPPELP